jgi:hypothetical protein
MQVTLVEISKDFYHGVVEGESVYRVMQSPCWQNKWRAFTVYGPRGSNRLVVETETLKAMQEHLSQEAIV